MVQPFSGSIFYFGYPDSIYSVDLFSSLVTLITETENNWIPPFPKLIFSDTQHLAIPEEEKKKKKVIFFQEILVNLVAHIGKQTKEVTK